MGAWVDLDTHEAYSAGRHWDDVCLEPDGNAAKDATPLRSEAANLKPAMATQRNLCLKRPDSQHSVK